MTVGIMLGYTICIIYVCVCVCMYVCVYIYIYTHAIVQLMPTCNVAENRTIPVVFV